MILKNCTFFNEEFEKEFGDIVIENSKIAALGLTAESGLDMSGKIILPGFVDIHIHGCGGGDSADRSNASLNKMCSFLAAHGVTSFCPTTMTDSIEGLVKTAEFISDYAKSRNTHGAKIAGINFEGPFISMEKCGSQKAEHIKAGTVEAFETLYNASSGMMKLITVAPEAFDSDGFIEYCSKKCAVSVGHTAADAKQCKRAIELGASHVTHLYNAMTPMAHREAGVVGTALDSDVTCELICDGTHISPAVLRNTFKILSENRGVAISDSMRGAGLGAGEYELGGQSVFVKDNDSVARLQDGTIAASITNLFDEFRQLINIGVDFKTALKACTINPARVIKKDNEIGSIAVGKRADLLVLDENLNLEEVYINGTLA